MVHGVNGLVVEPGNSQQISEAIVSLITDDVLANEIAGNARSTVSQKHSPEVVSRQISDVYEAVKAVDGVARKTEALLK